MPRTGTLGGAPTRGSRPQGHPTPNGDARPFPIAACQPPRGAGEDPGEEPRGRLRRPRQRCSLASRSRRGYGPGAEADPRAPAGGQLDEEVAVTNDARVVSSPIAAIRRDSVLRAQLVVDRTDVRDVAQVTAAADSRVRRRLAIATRAGRGPRGAALRRLRCAVSRPSRSSSWRVGRAPRRRARGAPPWCPRASCARGRGGSARTASPWARPRGRSRPRRAAAPRGAGATTLRPRRPPPRRAEQRLVEQDRLDRPDPLPLDLDPLLRREALARRFASASIAASSARVEVALVEELLGCLHHRRDDPRPADDAPATCRRRPRPCAGDLADLERELRRAGERVPALSIGVDPAWAAWPRHVIRWRSTPKVPARRRAGVRATRALAPARCAARDRRPRSSSSARASSARSRSTLCAASASGSATPSASLSCRSSSWSPSSRPPRSSRTGSGRSVRPPRPPSSRAAP